MFETHAGAQGGILEKGEHRRSSDGSPLLPTQGIKAQSEVKVENERYGEA